MRAAPAALARDSDDAAARDCALTNPDPVCVAATRAYVAVARALLAGTPANDAVEQLLETALLPCVDATIRMAVADGAAAARTRDVTGPGAGWVLHALYCAFYAITAHPMSFESGVDAVIRMGGDTDTNAAIAGALLGAAVGEQGMAAEERTGRNIAVLTAYSPADGDLPRPVEYAPQRLVDLCESLARM